MKIAGVVLISFFFLMIPCIFIGVGTHFVISQHKMISRGLPIEARILSKNIEEHSSTDSHGHHSTSYQPVVEYVYDVGTQHYTAKRVTPLNISSGRGWAEEMIAPFRVGGNCTAYYNPENPGEAFLVRKYSFFPYVFILFPMVFIALAIWIISGGFWRGMDPRPPIPRPGGWHEVPGATKIASQAKGALGASIIRTQSRNSSSISSQICFEQWMTPMENYQARGGEILQFDLTYALPDGSGEPTSPADQKEYPKYGWKIRINAEIANNPDYKADYPIRAES
ncbi:DUF3592 domain-containing protein [Candidatus Sumerlaeota bacterium]|nr:DUF3592 domain-containing protein [Candidatus Sumerlaeota bacterium]